MVIHRTGRCYCGYTSEVKLAMCALKWIFRFQTWFFLDSTRPTNSESGKKYLGNQNSISNPKQIVGFHADGSKSVFPTKYNKKLQEIYN